MFVKCNDGLTFIATISSNTNDKYTISYDKRCELKQSAELIKKQHDCEMKYEKMKKDILYLMPIS